MRKWYNTKESMGGYPSEIGDETAFVELDEAQDEIDKYKTAILICYSRKVNAEIDALKKEIEVLRQFGNKDCTAMADEYMDKGE